MGLLLEHMEFSGILAACTGLVTAIFLSLRDPRLDALAQCRGSLLTFEHAIRDDPADHMYRSKVLLLVSRSAIAKLTPSEPVVDPCRGGALANNDNIQSRGLRFILRHRSGNLWVDEECYRRSQGDCWQEIVSRPHQKVTPCLPYRRMLSRFLIQPMSKTPTRQKNKATMALKAPAARIRGRSNLHPPL
ncbi:hypothetical protein MOK15_06565 [Sphingobium sp. BYY-5]|uniref:hypothetical protein n=1 Tax=Sphingobium sp. BYY-5 TaxID=2926400 RepID=UPI001FA6C0E4|nr:hypothetical protein [Sphingobium sp. BYY-5]MCI4589753.1 hypothetical protein [Sphingobium sp. BYY-5]